MEESQIETTVNNVCQRHSYKRLKVCLYKDCQFQILFCQDCDKQEDKLHKRHQDKMISYDSYISQLSKNAGKISQDLDKFCQEKDTKASMKIYKDQQQQQVLIEEQESRVKDQKFKIDNDIKRIQEGVAQNLAKVRAVYFESLDKYLDDFKEQIRNIEFSVNVFDSQRYKYNFSQYTNFIKNKMFRLDRDGQTDYLKQLREMNAKNIQDKKLLRELKEKFSNNETSIATLQQNMPHYDNSAFSDFTSELKYVQNNYFSKNFTDFTTELRNDETVQKINMLFDKLQISKHELSGTKAAPS